MGEQLLRRDQGDVPLVIFRPAIIEGSYQEPAPGWIDGLRTADPIIVSYGTGKLNEFPADAGVPIDLIPADVVLTGTLPAMPTRGPAPLEGRRPAGAILASFGLHQCGTHSPASIDKRKVQLVRKS